MSIKLGNTTINRTYLGLTEINKAYLGPTLIVDQTPDTGFLPILSNFRVENAQPTRIYFDSSEIITGTDRTGYIVTDKSTTGNVFVSPGSLTGHYFTVTLAFTYWDNNTIRYNGTGGISDLYSHKPAPFTLQYITNNIDEPINTSFKYASATGSGARNGADTSNEWTYAEAGTNASGGDTVYCKAGSSTASLNVSATDGTATSPVKFIGYRVTPGDAQEVTRTIGMSFDSAEMPLITGAKFDTLAKDYIIVKNFQVQPNSTSIDPFDVSGSDYLVFENCYAADGKNGWFTFRNTPVTNIRLKRIYSGDMGDTGLILVNRSHLVDDAFVCSSKVVHMDYYIAIYGGTNGGNTIVRNSQVFRYQSDTHTNPHGITFKANEYYAEGERYILKYGLVENCTVDNVAEGVSFRHSTCTDSVARNITATQSGGSYGNLVTFRDDANNNIIENSFADGVSKGVLFNMNAGEDIGVQPGGHDNKVINTVFSGVTSVIYVNDGISGTAQESTGNEFLNNTYYNCSNFVTNNVVSFGSTNLVTNGILDTVTTKGSTSETYTYSDFYNCGSSFDSLIGVSNNIDVEPYLDYSDFSLTSQTPSSVYEGGTDIGVYYDKDGRENITPFSLGSYYKNASDTYPDYFVNATNGSDSNDGSTEFLAFQTINKVITESSTFVAGDTIAFKSGASWEGTRYFSASHPSGTSGNPITFTSYGSGEKPIITLKEDQSPSWNDEGGNIWSTSRGIMRTWKNGVELLMASSLSQLQNTSYGTGWWEDSGTTYIYSTTDPSLDTYSWASSNYVFYIENADYITFNNLDIQGGSDGAIRGYYMDNLTVINCNIGKDSRAGIPTRYSDNIYYNNNTYDADFTVDMSNLPEDETDFRGVGDGVVLWQGCNDGIISNNYLKNWGHNAINLSSGDIALKTTNIKVFNNEMTCPDIGYGKGLTTEGYVEDSELYNNYIHNTAKTNQFGGYRNHIHHNIIIDVVAPVMMSNKANGAGIFIQNYYTGIVDNIIENNVIINTEGQGIWMSETASGIGDTTGNIIRNNILYNTGTVESNVAIRYVENVPEDIYDNYFYNNLVYNSSTTLTCQYQAGGTIYNTSNFNSQNADISNNIDGDPLFIDVNANWRLNTGSNAIDAGTPALSTLDYYGETMDVTTPDIGISDNN